MSSTYQKNTAPRAGEEDQILDLTLRPKSWQEYIGQEKTKESLRIIIEAAKQRGDVFCEHFLFYGAAGLGKTTLAHLIAREMDRDIRVISGPAVEKVGDLAAILTNLSEGEILFIDELHRLNKLIEESLYSAMEEFKLHLILGKGPMAKTMEISLPHFTLIGATTRLALISSPLRSRFGATFQLNFYDQKDMEKIIERSSGLLGIEVDPEAVKCVSSRARFTPRVANRLLKRVRDFAQVEGQGRVTKEIAEKALHFLEVDAMGLETGDRKIMQALCQNFNGGPVGLQALAAFTSEEEDTILDIYEPYLMQIGFIERTPRGRMATKLAFQHFGGFPQKNEQNFLI